VETHPPPDKDQESLRDLFPAGVASVLSRSPTSSQLEPAELVAARAFAPRRMREFRHGRDCARSALLQLGAPAIAIPVGNSRQPLWPQGIVGSISHCGDVAGAAVGRSNRFAGIGIDIEADEPVDAALIERICTAGELLAIRAMNLDEARGVRHLFSMKEAAYKALWPLTKQFLEFQDIEVKPDKQAGRFSVTSPTGLCPSDLAVRLSGRYAILDGLFVSTATIMADVQALS